MTLLLIVLLVLLWAAVIVPTLLRARQSPASSVGAFRRNMQALGARATAAGGRGRRASRGARGAVAPGRWILGPAPRRASRPVARRTDSVSRAGYGTGPLRVRGSEAPLPSLGGLTIDQRRHVFYVLLGAAVATLAVGLFYGPALLVHLGTEVVLAGYVVYLIRTKPRREPEELVAEYRPSQRRAAGERERSGDYLRAGEL